MSEQKCPMCGGSYPALPYRKHHGMFVHIGGHDVDGIECLRNQLAQRDARIAELEGRYEKAVQALWMGPDSLASEVIRDYEENYFPTPQGDRKGR